MKLKVANLAIEGFRAFRRLEIVGLGRVNLITGRNNTGKSSVLEALRIFASSGSPAVINDILSGREEDIGEPEGQASPGDAEGLFQISSLFHGFPQLSELPKSIGIATNGDQRPMTLTLQVDWVAEVRDAGDHKGTTLYRQLTAEDRPAAGQLAGPEIVPALVVRTENASAALPLGRLHRASSLPWPWEGPRIPCVFVCARGGEGTATLGPLWDKIALSDREKDVVGALRIIDPGISAVSMIGRGGSQRTRTAVVRSDNISRPVPLRSLGEGLNRLFGIVLSLVSAKDGLLLIDEFENGMHHTVQLNVWRTVFRVARELDIQVFATSHSWDSIEAFQKAAAEAPEDGVLVRLSRKGEDIIPTLFREDDLAVVTRDRIEVRG